MDSNEYVEVVRKLNNWVIEKDLSDYGHFKYETNGDYDVIMFNDYCIHGNDDSYYDENVHLDFYSFIQHRVNNYIDNISKLRFKFK